MTLVWCLKVKWFVDATAEPSKPISGSEKNKQLSESKGNSKELNDLSINTNKENEITPNNSQKNNEKHFDAVAGKFVSFYKNMSISQILNSL